MTGKLYTLITPPAFRRTAKKFFKSHPELRERFKSILDILIKDPTNPALKMHPLGGKLKGLHAIRLTYQYRITLILKITEKEIILVDIGSHDDVYR